MILLICFILCNILWLYAYLRLKKEYSSYKMVEGAKTKFYKLMLDEMKQNER